MPTRYKWRRYFRSLGAFLSGRSAIKGIAKLQQSNSFTCAKALAIPIAIELRETGNAMPTRNINLTDQLDRFVERQVSSGRYSNASEIVRDALHLLEEREQEREAKLVALRRAARQRFDQIDQGQGIKLTGRKAISRFIGEVECEVRSHPTLEARL